MKLTIYSDLHLYAPHSWILKEPDILNELLFPKIPIDSILLTGDIIDIANCKKSKLVSARYMIQYLKNMYQERFLIGNHECMKPDALYRVIYGCLVCHGHTLYWDYAKVKKWEEKVGGKGKLSRAFYTIYKRATFPFSVKTKRPPEHVIEKAKTLARMNGVSTVIFGHSHSYWDETTEGIRIINVPRGKTEVEI